MHSFAPDFRSGTIVKGTSGTDQEKAVKRVPRHLLASFTGEVTVEAVVLLQDGDQAKVSGYLENEYDLRIDESTIPERVTMSRNNIFSRGDYVKTEMRIDFAPKLKSKGQRKFRDASRDEISHVWEALREFAPDIAYYPTFIFDFPERIYLTHRAGVSDNFFKSVIADILAVDGQGYTLDDLTRRVRGEKFTVPWSTFLPTWTQGDDKRKIQQIIDRASSAVTRNVFGKWSKIFGEDIGTKELVVEFDLEEGRVLSSDKKTWITSEKHDIYVWFEIKDGARRFRVNDRSLGFRWFFAFLLFTQFRVARKSDRSVLFLFDEPAANLHAAAQQKLIESFPGIAGGDNMLIYTTHSHYMIEPAWLEQTFIVSNKSEARRGSIVDSATLDDESLDIQAQRYRKFVNDNPSDTSFFQPIVDRLEVVPSKFDYNLPSVVVEGKSDYYILEYARKLSGLGPSRFIPGTGSGTFEALISISTGWGVKFLFLLDADKAGQAERARYAADFGAPLAALTTIIDFLPTAKEIESLLDEPALRIIMQRLDVQSKLSKKQIQRFFQEQLAKGEIVDLGSGFKRDASTLLVGLANRLDQL